jgi:4-hydroxy-tetrahydrodipicolinate reductase
MKIMMQQKKSPILVGLLGTGRMGKKLLKHLLENTEEKHQVSQNIQLSRVFTRTLEKQNALRQEYPLLTEEHFTSSLKTLWQDATVIVDLSHPDSWLDQQHELFPRPVFMGTTGLSIEQENLLLNYHQHAAVLRAPNASLSHVRLLKALESVLNILPKAQWALTEHHHVHKKDAPSGTGKTIQDKIEILTKHPLPVFSLRMGKSPPKHELTGCDAYEKISFIHEVFDPQAYVEGILEGIRWLSKKFEKKPVQKRKYPYGMEDLFEK